MSLFKDNEKEYHRQYHRKWWLANKARLQETRREYARKYNTENKEAIWEREFIRRFKKKGLSEIEVHKALTAWRTFDGVCQACGKICSKQFHTDHDHVNLIFRGIVGGECNQSLGLVKDSPERLRALANYLERFQ